jgi:hypothetical protein
MIGATERAPRAPKSSICVKNATRSAMVDYLYSLYDALIGINVPNDKARAVVDATERDMNTTLATKSDLLLLRQELKTDIVLLRKDMEAIESRLAIRLGSITVLAMGVLFAALKLG